MGIDLHAQMLLHEINMSQRGVKIHDSLFCGGEIRAASPNDGLWVHNAGCELQHVDVRRLHLARVPHPSFPLVHLYPGVVPRMHPQLCVNNDDPLQHNVDVIKESQEVFVREPTIFHGDQSSVLTHCEQSGHQWVALRATLSLDDLVSHSKITIPNVRGSGTVEWGQERRTEFPPSMQPLEHGSSRGQVESHPVHKEHCCIGIHIRQRLDDMGDALHSGSCGEGVLEWCCRTVNGRVDLLRDRSGQKTTEHTSHDDPPNSA